MYKDGRIVQRKVLQPLFLSSQMIPSADKYVLPSTESILSYLLVLICI